MAQQHAFLFFNFKYILVWVYFSALQPSNKKKQSTGKLSITVYSNAKTVWQIRRHPAVWTDGAERWWVWSTHATVKDTQRSWNGRAAHQSNSSTRCRWPYPWDTEFRTFFPSSLFLSFYPFLPFLSLALSVLSLTFFVSCKKPPCPEGIDLQDCFDPVVMILLFASATSFSLLQSPHKMLWIRPGDGMVGEKRRQGGERRGEWCSRWVLRRGSGGPLMWPGMERWVSQHRGTPSLSLSYCLPEVFAIIHNHTRITATFMLSVGCLQC